MPKDDPVITLSRGSESIVLGSEAPIDGFLLSQGVTGLGIAPTEQEFSPVPSGNGSILRSSRLTDREIFLPVLISGPTYERCDERRDELFAMLDPTKGPIRVTVQSNTRNRDARWVDAVYTDGLTGDYGSGFTGYTHKVGLVLKTPSAFWSQDQVSRLFQISPGMKPFLSTTSSFFPMTLYSSSIAGVFPVEVQGTQPVWPTITVTGPGTDLTIRAGGKKIMFEGDIAVGRRITFDTANGDVYDMNNTDGQLWSRVSLDTEFFQLQPGLNDVQVTFTGATTSSLLELSYEPQWLTGY